MDVHVGDQIAQVRLRANAIQTHRIESLKDIAIFPMLGRSSVLRHELQNVLKARDYAFLARRPRRRLPGVDDDSQFLQQLSVAELSHERFAPHGAPGPQALRPSAAPTGPVNSEPAAAPVPV